MHELTEARRVVGFARLGVMPTASAVQKARETLGDTLGEMAQSAPVCGRVLSYLSYSMLPAVSLCKAAMEEINPYVLQAMTERAKELQAPSHERQRG